MGEPSTRQTVKRLQSWLDALFVNTDQRLGGRLALLYRTWLAFAEDDGATMAASIAYYALFSSFPLLLLMLTFGSSVLASPDVQQVAIDLVERYVPAASELVLDNIGQVVRARNTVGVLALIGLFWSASGVFGAIYRAVNRAWGHGLPGSFWRRRLYGLAMILGVGGLFLATTVYSTAISFVRGWRVPILGWQPFADAGVGRLFGWLSALVPLLASVTIFCLVYRTVPRVSVTWREVWPGGVAAGLIWEGAKQLFTWYLGNFARYSLIYGSVGAIIAFLLWSYLSGIILLLGAEFTAEYGRWRRAGRPVESRAPSTWRKEWSRWESR
jgi:membrane protein